MFQSFRTRITLLFGGLALAMAAGLSAAVGHLMAQRLTADGGESLHTLAQAVSGVLAEGLADKIKDVELLAGTASAAQWNDHRRELNSSLTRLQRGGSAYAWIGIVDAAGKVQLATRDMLLGQDVSSRPWFEAARAGTYLGDVHPAKLLAALLPPSADGGPARFVDFAAPIRGADGQLLGVVGAHGDWDWAGRVIDQLRGEAAFARGVRVFIVDRHGVIIRRPRDVPRPPPDSPPEKLVLGTDADGGQFLTWPDGRRYLTAREPLAEVPGVTPLGWTIVTRQPEADALASAVEIRWRVAGLGLVVVAMAMFCIWIAAGRVSLPLREIAVAARRIEAGELAAADIPEAGGSAELRNLSAGLRRMTQALLDGKAALQTANNSLEARVAERTEALAEANRALEQLAHHDGLTGLLNRRSADARLGLELARHLRHGHDLGLLLLDIDHFKRINDERGHAVGDDVLRRLAGCLKAQCRVTDVLARFGGEEFLLLLPETGGDDALHVAEKLRRAVAALDVPGLWPLSVSIGVSSLAGGRVPPARRGSGPSEPTADELLRQADEALYQAKREGRNRVVVYAASLRAPASSRAA